MARTVAIGIQDFETLVSKNNFYIDKTAFIKEWWESNDHVTLITRPRRFGKTLNMSMLEHFFSLKYQGQGELFHKLNIWKEKSYQQMQGAYPVISLSFAGIKQNNYDATRRAISHIIAGTYAHHDYLRSSAVLTDVDREYWGKISTDMDEVDIAMAIYNLCDYLYRYHGRKIIVLLDEYDTPMQEAYINGFWDELVSLTRNLFNNTFKANPYLERAVMTGITRVSKESVFSDLNNLKVVTTTSERYECAFGFTENEVFQALDEFRLADKKKKVKDWYDGFTFGKQTDIYNPWSITSFLDTKKFDTHWANTSTNSLIGTLIQKSNIRTKKAMEDLLEGKPLLTELDEQIVFDQLEEDETAIWSLMLASGYLKQLNVKEIDEGIWQYELTLTNKEVGIMFRNMIRKWFRKRDSSAYSEFIQAFLQNDKRAMNYYMNRVALNTFSYFDTGKKPSCQEPERFYHGFVLGLIVELRDLYHITSNRESGFGRYDVMLEPLSAEDTAYILEFKVYDSEDEKDLQDTIAAAHRQIDEKGYDANLLARGIKKENIRHYGFAFRGKEVLIG